MKMILAVIIWTLMTFLLTPAAIRFISHYCEKELSVREKRIIFLILFISGSAAGTLCFCIHELNIRSVMIALTVYALTVSSVVDVICLEIPPLMNGIILLCSAVICAADISDIVNHLCGTAVIGGIFLLIYLLSKGKAMGGGDVKLMAAACLGLGLNNSVFAALVAFPLAAITETIKIKLFNKPKTFAFGPYLACGIMVSWFIGSYVVSWYLSLIRLGG